MSKSFFFLDKSLNWMNVQIAIIYFHLKVPIGSVGMFEGQLIHTNEIMVLLGDNWFTQCSAHQAAEIISHRIEGWYYFIDKCQVTLLIKVKYFG